jgi:drug/metabolite transporter (DMT)-like permease
VSPFVVALVLAAAIAHATWNLAQKRASATGATFLWLAFGVGAIALAPFGIASLIAENVGLARWAGIAAVSGLLQVGYFFMLQRAYAVADISIVYPLARGTGPLLTVIFALLLFGEQPSVGGAIGASLVIAGVVVIGLAGSSEHAAAHARTRIGVAWGLAVGVVIASYTLWDAHAVVGIGLPPLGYYWGAVVVQFALLTWSGVRGKQVRSTVRDNWMPVLAVGILSPLAYILILWAFQLAPVSLVAPAREISVVIVSVAGWLIFREPNPVQRLVGSIIVVAGVAVLALS